MPRLKEIPVRSQTGTTTCWTSNRGNGVRFAASLDRSHVRIDSYLAFSFVSSALDINTVNNQSTPGHFFSRAISASSDGFTVNNNRPIINVITLHCPRAAYGFTTGHVHRSAGVLPCEQCFFSWFERSKRPLKIQYRISLPREGALCQWFLTFPNPGTPIPKDADLGTHWSAVIVVCASRGEMTALWYSFWALPDFHRGTVLRTTALDQKGLELPVQTKAKVPANQSLRRGKNKWLLRGWNASENAITLQLHKTLTRHKYILALGTRVQAACRSCLLN